VPNLSFRAADGTRLAGYRWGHGHTAVVLAHEIRGGACQWADYGPKLAALGYTALAFDFRNYGASEVRHYPANQRWGGDVAAAAKEVRRLGATKVFLLGASLGGSAVVDAGANIRPQVDGVISVSGAADLANAIAAAPHLRAPVLFLAGAGDTDFARDAHRLYAAAGSHDKTLKIVASGAHGVLLVGGSPAVRKLIAAFIASH
jgi:alpha-beta hydrolase superfamily lysophospholipase